MNPKTDVVLATMPYAHVMRPSIALGILKSALLKNGISCSVEYANVRFVEQIGIDVNSLMMHLRTDSLIGEWTFAGAAFREERDTLGQLLGNARSHQPPNIPSSAVDERRFEETFRRLRNFAPEFVDETAKRILARSPRVVGCSSTFEQHCAAIALLRRVKELSPSTAVILGGANCEAEMGWATLKNCAWLDYVFSGEADTEFVTICQDLLDGRDPVRSMIPGLLARAHIRMGKERAFVGGHIPRAQLSNLDLSPSPNFDDYFRTIEASPIRPHLKHSLAVETSRGCWWGQKSHCTFCGLNGEGMSYRAKAPLRILEEWSAMSARYDTRKMFVVDNIIDMNHVRDLLPQLAEQGSPYDLFYETKSNLRRDHIKLFKQAGISKIQPGIEGLHDSQLKLMAKGNSAAKNVQLLKYTREMGIYTTWMMLVGFPGEEKQWYAEVAEWLPLLAHMQPPTGVVKVRFDRFSVYFNEQERYGLRLEPYPAYGQVFPYPPEDLRDAAYFFYDEANPNSADVPEEIMELGDAVKSWKSAFVRSIPPVLCATPGEGSLQFFDTRPCAVERRVTLTGVDMVVYNFCDLGCTLDRLATSVERADDGSYSRDEVIRSLDRLIEQKLVLNLNGTYVGLACLEDVKQLSDYSDYPNGHIDRFDSNRWANATQAFRHLETSPPVFKVGCHYDRGNNLDNRA
ncbi:MAG: RiPP maturation radical SAM C-methyltransferase [Myxococcota bacterium]|nr:RiPP maturation radical SAM C-methyltransferase [Myxococcota bacterium]